MTTIFDDLIFTSYGQLTLTTVGEDLPMPDLSFQKQQNGLCGAATRGSLFLVIGTHTGEVPVRVICSETEPALGDWEEIVEVDFVADDRPLALAGWASDPSVVFELPAGRWRARWSGTGMDAAREGAVPAPDTYELSFWPTAAPSPDTIVRCTGTTAAYWHDEGFAR